MRRLLPALFTMAPFVAGTVAALSARRDVRMLWTAAASGVAVLLGAHGAVGVAMVAVVLAAFATAGAALGNNPQAAV